MRDLKNAVIVLLSILIFGMLFATVLYSNAEAQPLTTYKKIFTLVRGFDTWTVDSVGACYADNTLAADSCAPLVIDTMWVRGFTADTLQFYVDLSATGISKTINGSVFFYAGLSDGRYIKEVVDITHMVHSVDTARQSPNAVATVDYDTLAGIVDDSLTAVHGAGSWQTGGGSGTGAFPDTMFVYDSANSAIVQSARLIVKSEDTATLAAGTSPILTNASGYAIFSIDSGVNYPVNAAVTGFAMETAYELESIADPGGRDTIYVYAVSVPNIAGPGLTSVTFNFFDGTGDSTKNVILRYKLSSTSSENWHFDSTKVFDPSEVFESRSDTSGQVTVNVVPNDSIYTAGYQTGKTTWQFWAINPTTGKQILGEDGIKITVPASASGLIWPEDFE